MSVIEEVADQESVRPSSTWHPLSEPLFRALWLAAVASNIGTWMHNIVVTHLIAEDFSTRAKRRFGLT